MCACACMRFLRAPLPNPLHRAHQPPTFIYFFQLQPLQVVFTCASLRAAPCTRTRSARLLCRLSRAPDGSKRQGTPDSSYVCEGGGGGGCPPPLPILNQLVVYVAHRPTDTREQREPLLLNGSSWKVQFQTAPSYSKEGGMCVTASVKQRCVCGGEGVCVCAKVGVLELFS